MKIFVTGGAGFVGRSLTKSLIEKNHNVIIFDNLSNSSENAIKPFLDKVDFIKCDITNYDDISSSIKSSYIVIHLASKINVQESFANPNLTKNVNVDGTKNLLEACKENKIMKIIAASSAAVYSDCNDSNVYLSENSKTGPISPYGKSKLEMEEVIRKFSKLHGLNAVILRFFNIFGIEQSPEYAGVITKFFERINENRSLEVFGDGLQTRDFISVEDAVGSIHNTIANIEGKYGNIFNIASGKSTSIKELAKLMILISGKNLDIYYSPKKDGEIKFSQADISLAKKELHFSPRTELKEKIKNLIK